MDVSTSTVPVIDLTPFREGGEAGKRAVAALVGAACRDIGFLTISGHGIPDALIQRCYDTAAEFFALPIEEKMRCERPAPDQVRGYSAVGGEGLSYSLGEPAPPDLKESLTIGPTDVPLGDPYFNGPAAGPHFAPNLWPDRPADLHQVWTAYFAAMETLAADLMRMFALALDLPEAFFEDKINHHISMFRALRYPSQAEPPLPGQLRAGAHSDYGSLTILRQENRPGGLEVRDKSGAWVPVVAIPGTFVVNIGDLMMQWTNDTWISTMHRVVNPPWEKAGDSDRISLVFFHQPNYDAIVSCLDSCQSAAHPAKYAPVSSGDHLRSKFVRQTTLDASPEGAVA
jgi:isopenicillin N synthase-like dioxygenase